MAELGFLGVVVYTRVHTPRFWGQEFRAGALLLSSMFDLPLRTNCCIVGIRELFCSFKLDRKSSSFFYKNNNCLKKMMQIMIQISY